ncbi:histone H1 [Lentinula guzmanii]|uniref:Histone H1 n=1 Tax=Lentinula guzmanii TaxID=2804957 RepID=A0AA38JA88_9AGAR|nr:histone H1 [Lentinula guzmanii]
MAVSKKSSTIKTKTPSGKSHNAAHPTWIDMIKECIIAYPEDARTGVSRPTIKKFVENKYKIDVNASTASQLNRAITSGSEKGVFVLPKGPSGKVKLAPKVRSDATKENATPAVKKPVSKSKAPSTRLSASKKAPTTKASAPEKVRPSKASAVLKPSPTKAPTVKKYSSSKKSAQSRATTLNKKVAPSKNSASTARKPSNSKKGSTTKGTATAKKSIANKPKVANARSSASKAKASVPKAKPIAKASARPKSATKKAAAAIA